MAWIDDRIYCHPKVLMVSKPARWTYIAGIAYSAGWGTQGVLERSALSAIGSTNNLRKELVAQGLWDEVAGVILIHDWNEHNEKRDSRRRADRERKRTARSTGISTGMSAGQSADKRADKLRTGALPARVDGSEGSDGSEELTMASFPFPKPPPNPVARPPASQCIDGLEPLAAIIPGVGLGVAARGNPE